MAQGGLSKFTSAYTNFATNISRSRSLLEYGAAGITDAHGKNKSLLGKLGPRVALPSNERDYVAIDAEIEAMNVVRLPDGVTRINCGAHVLDLLQSVVAHQDEVLEGLQPYFHNVLCVAIWGHFETYVHDALTEVFTNVPLHLKSEKTLTVAEVIEAQGDLFGYIIEKEMSDAGRLSFRKLNAYLGRRLQYQLPDDIADTMDGFYLLRNIIAHSSGSVRRAQEGDVPPEVAIVSGQLQISREVLSRMIEVVKKSVELLDDHIGKILFSGS